MSASEARSQSQRFGSSDEPYPIGRETAVNRAPDLSLRLAALRPDRRRPVLMHHGWESLLFLHWEIRPERVQSTLPEGLSVDTFDRKAYLGIVPFFMRGIRSVGTPALPWLANFQELNVRTYVHGRDGTPGVWFFSLDCNQPIAVATARLLTGLPYFHAQMSVVADEWIDYSCRRRGSSEAARYIYRGFGEAREADHSSLEFFLLERYYLYALRRGSLVRAQVSHERYQYRKAEVREWSLTPAQLDGFPELSGAPAHCCFVDGLDVRIYGTQLLSKEPREKGGPTPPPPGDQ